MAYKVRLAEPAKEDAIEYATFIRDVHKSPVAARKWLDGLHEAIRGLGDQPQRYSVIPEAEELGFQYRSFVYHSHRVVFGIDDEAGVVIVHRVYHSARRSLTGLDME